MFKKLRKILYREKCVSLQERDTLLRDEIIAKAMSYPIIERANVFLELVSFLKRLEILKSLRQEFAELKRIEKFNPVVREMWMEFKDDPNYILTPSGEIINKKQYEMMYNER